MAATKDGKTRAAAPAQSDDGVSGIRAKLIVASTAAALTLAGVLWTHYEGTRYVAYQDSVGVWSICEGHTKGVHQGDTATPAQCAQYVREDLAEANAAVERCIHVPLSVGQRAAFIDLVGNMGPRAVCGSTLQRLANAGDLAGACRQLTGAGPRYDGWTHIAGRVSQWLVQRRTDARELCLAGLAK